MLKLTFCKVALGTCFKKGTGETGILEGLA